MLTGSLTNSILPEGCRYTREVSSTSQILDFPGTENYENNHDCQSTLTSPGGRIRIDFGSFDTETNQDYLSVTTTNFYRFVIDNF